MRLDNVIQFRVSTEEKEELQRKAGKQTLSDFIREALGLPVGLKNNPHVSEATREKSITELARQRHAHLPLAFAERKVKEELR
jgi:hypothetical protein